MIYVQIQQSDRLFLLHNLPILCSARKIIAEHSRNHSRTCFRGRFLRFLFEKLRKMTEVKRRCKSSEKTTEVKSLISILNLYVESL